jgi:P-type Cu2+ transporter
MAATEPHTGGGEKQAELEDVAREALRDSAPHGDAGHHLGHHAERPTAHERHREHAGHDKHAGHSPEMFKRKFWGSLVLTLLVLAFDQHFLALVGLQPLVPGAPGFLAPLFGSLLYFYGGWPFLQGAVRELKERAPGMMTLIALGITVAYAYSLTVTFGLSQGMALWWELATLVTIMVLGHWIEMASVQGASRALDELASLVPSTAHRLTSGKAEEVQVSGLREGDLVLVRPGEQVPVDGRVTDGASSVNEAFLTGESQPVEKEPGAEVIAGAVNGEGALTVVVTRTGAATTLSQIQRLVVEAQSSRSRFQNLADRAAAWLFFIALGAGTATFVVWLLLGAALDFAIIRTVTVLVMACPHALGLAIPLVVVNATALSARHGILVRNREAFERARDLKVVAFDKTGTLTEGRFGVRKVYADGVHEEEGLRLAAALEARSEHPLALAVVAEAERRGLQVPPVEDFEVIAGKGVAGRVEGNLLRIGRPEWAGEHGATVSESLAMGLAEAEASGESVVALMNDQRVLALVAMADQVRKSAKEAILRLKEAGVEPVMITGDAEAVAKTVAASLGLSTYRARVLPHEKAAIVRELKERGPTAFVGDGINDAPALLEADLGVAIGAGTNVAIESADLVLVESDPLAVVRAMQLSRATYRKMVQNLFWATGYNAVALPLAAGVAAGAGVMLSPAAGAVFMSVSTVVVAVNAVLLRRVSLA